MASTRIAIGMKYKKPPYYTTTIFIGSEIRLLRNLNVVYFLLVEISRNEGAPEEW